MVHQKTGEWNIQKRLETYEMRFCTIMMKVTQINRGKIRGKILAETSLWSRLKRLLRHRSLEYFRITNRMKEKRYWKSMGKLEESLLWTYVDRKFVGYGQT